VLLLSLGLPRCRVFDDPEMHVRGLAGSDPGYAGVLGCNTQQTCSGALARHRVSQTLREKKDVFRYL
jgi:hypothetical protein